MSHPFSSVLPIAHHTGQIRIGHHVLICYVLNDGRRAFLASDLTAFFGLPNERRDAEAPAAVWATLKAFEFTLPSGERCAGYEASVLIDLASALLDAAQGGALDGAWAEQAVTQAALIFKTFPGLGMKAVADEAAGHQQQRDPHNLQGLVDQGSGVILH